ncbi:MAG: T9SS type A sorting domain-containing protein [Flavobacteriales bacterium]
MLAFSADTTDAFAQAGTLDPSFATAGIGIYLPASQNDLGYDLIALPDNRMLVCGFSSNGGFVTHILEDGTVDASFGEANGTTFFASTVDAMALAPDQSIYLRGVSADNIFLAHISALGIPDQDFGTDGVILTPVNATYTQISDMVIQPDGKIVLVGFCNVSATYYNASLFVRFLPDGSLDTGFNGTGILSLADAQSHQYMRAVAMLDDGSILGAGYSDNGFTEHLLMSKLHPDGTPDAMFGTAGTLSPSLGGLNAEAYGMLVNEDGMYVVGYLWENIGNASAYIAKFNADGTSDTSFGTNGSTISDFGSFDYLSNQIAQPDGKIVACGATAPALVATSALTIRYTTSGLLDPTYGDGGKTITTVGIISDGLKGIALEPDGRIVVAGSKSDIHNVNSMMVMRYLGDGSVGFSASGTSSVQYVVFPDPVTGNSATIGCANAGGAELWITDMRGRIAGAIVHVPQGATTLELDVKELASGMYLVNVLSQGITSTLKMQVVK